jgi:FkbM family methyltransferase
VLCAPGPSLVSSLVLAGLWNNTRRCATGGAFLSDIVSRLKAALPAPVKRVLRAKALEIRRWSFHPYTTHLSVPTRTGEESISFYVGDSVGELWYVRKDDAGKDSVPYIRWILGNLVSPDDVIIECGAHHGYYSVILAKALRSGYLAAVEAHPANAQILRKNIEVNGLQGRVEAISAAVGGQSGEVTLIDSSNAAVVNAGSEDIPKILVRMVSIDELARQIKGMELEALKGARSVLAQTPKLNIELHCQILREQHRQPPSAVFDCLPADRYEFWMQPDDNRPEVARIDAGFLFENLDRVQLYAVPRKRVS